jgi:hypothetical protein
MADRPFARDEVPDRLRAAKEEAVRHYLFVDEMHLPRPRYAAYAAISEPRHNVVGIGIGHKLIGGVLTGKHAVRFYVAHKLPKHLLPPGVLLPRKIGSVDADVIETGHFTSLPAVGNLVKEVRARQRPARPGCSVGFHFADSRGPDAGIYMAGTFGAVARDKAGALGLLSNNHVLADENRLHEGNPIFQQGLLDGGDPKGKKDRIGELRVFHPLTTKGPNTVDCAFAAVSNASDIACELLGPIGKLKSGAPLAAVHGAKVEKVGRTTGYTRGDVRDVTADVKIQYDIGMLLFKDQIVVLGTPPFSDAGDSGSLVVDVKTKQPTGLLFGGSRTHTLVNHIADVVQALGLEIEVAGASVVPSGGSRAGKGARPKR